MKSYVLSFVSLGFLLFSCDESQKAIIEPKEVQSAASDTTLSGANLRPYPIGPDLVIYKVVQSGPVGDVPDGTPDPLVYVPAFIYVKNVGNRTAYASYENPVRISYFRRVQVGTVSWQQPAPTYIFETVTGWQYAWLRANLNPGETRILYETLGVDARDLPPSKIIQLSCVMDPTNQVIETDEANNTQGIWNLNFGEM
jgi:hypothetical protein